MKGNLTFNPIYEKTFPKLIDFLKLKLVYRETSGKKFYDNLFCGLYIQVVLNPNMVSLVLSMNHFASVIKLVSKTCYLPEFCAIYPNNIMIMELRETNRRKLNFAHHVQIDFLIFFAKDVKF